MLNEKPGVARYAVVGTENRNGTDMKWIEYKVVGGKSNDTTVFQMLVPSGPHELGQVEEMVMKSGGRKAMKMTGMMMKMVLEVRQRQLDLSECSDCHGQGEG